MVIMKMKVAFMQSVADVHELLLRSKYSCEISEAIRGSGAPVGGIAASLCGTVLFLLVAIASWFHFHLFLRYVAPLVAVVASLITNEKSHAIALAHRLVIHRSSLNPSFHVSRPTPFADSVPMLLSGETQGCAYVNLAAYIGEDGSGRGVIRDWFTDVSNQIANPETGLFQPGFLSSPTIWRFRPWAG